MESRRFHWGRKVKKMGSPNDVCVVTIPVAWLITFHWYDVIPKTTNKRDGIAKHDVSFTSKYCVWKGVQINSLICNILAGKVNCPGLKFSIH
jgi:hypothetical protein